MGCATKNLNDPRIVIVGGSQSISISKVLVFENEAGFVRLAVQLANDGQSNATGFYSVEWLDAQSAPVQSILSGSRQITIGAKNTSTIDLIAPNIRAKDFRMRIELGDRKTHLDKTPT
jgi:uncharacterized protein YcfL